MEENEEIPKTQTESSGGGRPPGKTRVGGGAERPDDWDDVSYLRPKRSVGTLVVEARTVIMALLRELDKGENADVREILLLHDLFDVVLQEINNHANREAIEASEDLIRPLEKRRDDLKKFNKTNDKET